MRRILLRCGASQRPKLLNLIMPRSSHPSVRSRVSTAATGLDYIGQKIRAALPGGPSAKLPSRTPAPFHQTRQSFTLADAKKADELSAGRFHYAGLFLDVGPWTTASPSRRFASWLHEFDWLHDLLAGGTEAHHAKAREYVDDWIDTYGKGNEFVFEPGRLGRRLFNWLVLWSPALSGTGKSDAGSRIDSQLKDSGVDAHRLLERRRASVLRQLIALRGSLKSLPPGLPRITAGCALTLGGARLTDSRNQFLERGLDFLDEELPLQILPDGGHITRSPEACAEALSQLLTLDGILAARGVEGSRELSRAIDRLAPMVAFFQRSGGELAPFHGGSEMDARSIKKLLDAAPGQPKPFGYGPHVGFQRLDAEKTVAIIDTGQAPPRPYDLNAHLAPLALDLSTAEGPMITACGFNAEQPENWQRPVRAAAAHSTLVLDGRSPGRLLTNEWKRRTVGDAVECVAGPVKATRKEQKAGIWLESHHEGYMGEYGLSHRRRLFMPVDGDDVRGEDSLFTPVGSVPIRRDDVPFAIRFHIHPLVRVSLSQDKYSALLVVNGKAGWRFRTDGGQVALEDSVYLAKGVSPVKTQQLVISGRAFCDSDGESKSNRVRWSFSRLKPTEEKTRLRPTQTDIETLS